MEFEIVPVTRYKQNCSLVWCERTRRAVVIDPGGDLSEILNLIDLLELAPEWALVTHGHFDHCGAAAQFAELTGARIAGPHRGDAHLVANLHEPAERYGVPARDFTPSRWLEDGDELRFGEEVLQVLHCPGHSRGHVAYFSPSRRQAFVGDILFRGTIGAWEHPDGDLPTLVDSIRGKLFALGDDVAFVPGHGASSTMGRERAENPFVGDAAMARWRKRDPA
ncbi:MBL fold metallo-hydrolase [Novosphingobium album (ex Liu et al. 2023)]|uniref:MBL fold metallo-hydrolase n=1 Tax=Novosphingobium album (ex Liu et al. 2023) TaxID=3031130 RepID=A0ABT5WLU8_9SPHN|nr:MBL fold metallo-hydrolase [Novosphingobium album (ex Liu et al. 2023)]MDE8651020.1 MBL fold metallo-hydrolase [Novosphingobium album (ex Liu et al. 2023)]